MVDTTGAGDLFVAAWVDGQSFGDDVETRLAWAVLYSALSVRVLTAVAGALTLDQLVAEAAGRGLLEL